MDSEANVVRIHPQDMGALIESSTVKISSDGAGNGAGVLVSGDGVIVSCAHVVHGPTVEVRVADGAISTGEVTLRNAERDLAVIRVGLNDLPHLGLADSQTLRPGELVFSMGHPWGGRAGLAMGVVHATIRAGQRWPMVVSDIRLAPGYSGGPMVNSWGAVVGINAMVSGGLGLAIPSNEVKRLLAVESLPRLGVALRPVAVKAGFGTTRGLLVTAVAEGLPADSAGLQIGDTILSLNAKLVDHSLDLFDIMAEMPGALRLSILRAGRSLELSIPLRYERGGEERAAA